MIETTCIHKIDHPGIFFTANDNPTKFIVVEFHGDLFAILLCDYENHKKFDLLRLEDIGGETGIFCSDLLLQLDQDSSALGKYDIGTAAIFSGQIFINCRFDDGSYNWVKIDEWNDGTIKSKFFDSWEILLASDDGYAVSVFNG